MFAYLIILWLIFTFSASQSLNKRAKCFKAKEHSIFLKEIQQQVSFLNNDSLLILTSNSELKAKYKGQQCEITKTNFCILNALDSINTLVVEGNGQVCMELSSMERISQLKNRTQISIMLNSSKMYGFRPHSAVELQIYKLKGNPEIQIHICYIHHLSSCYDDLMMKEPSSSPMLTHFQKINLQYCSNCLIIMRVKCENHTCQFIVNRQKSMDSDQIQYLQYEDKFNIKSIQHEICVVPIYGKIKINSTVIKSEYLCTRQEAQVSLDKSQTNGLYLFYEIDQEIALFQGLPVYWNGNYTFSSTHNVIYVILQPQGQTDLKIFLNPEEKIEFSNLTSRLALTLSVSKNYKFEVASKSRKTFLCAYELQTISLKINHFYPTVSSFHHPAHYIVEKIESLFLKISACTTGLLFLQHKCEGQDEISSMIKAQYPIWEHKISCQKAGSLQIFIQTKHYVVFDLFVSDRPLNQLKLPKQVSSITYNHEGSRFYTFTRNTSQSKHSIFYSANDLNILTTALFCENILFSLNGKTHEFFKKQMNYQNNIFGTQIPENHNYVGIALKNSSQLLGYAFFDLNEKTNWKGWAIFVGVFISLSMILIGITIFMPSKKKLKKMKKE